MVFSHSLLIIYISIHVPRVEDDSCGLSVSRPPRYFNPRPPCGGRQLRSLGQPPAEVFQSTSPVWRTTSAMENREKIKQISIHVPRVEDDLFHDF